VVLERAMREVAERAARAKAESGLRIALQEAERANRAKDRFLAVLSHELRTPLASVSFAAHLLSKVAEVPEKYAELLPTIQRNVALEARLIDDLLDISAITNGKLGVHRATVDMREVLHQVVETSREQLAQKRITLIYTAPPQAAWVFGDEARLQQVVSNLLRNAIKFSPEGSSVRLSAGLEADGGFVFTCSDDGVGLETEALDRIFTAFEQADREVANRFGGLGLGLAIARHLAHEHAGSLTADSRGPGLGATFTLRLPGVPAPDPADAPEVETSIEAAPQPLANRVLLVEDNPSAAETLALCLDEYGWQPVHAATVAAAMALADEQDFDIVLTDLGLPDGSGVEIGRALSPRMPVVALSGYGSAADLRRTAEAGFTEHLVKPVDPEVIHEALRKSLAASRPGALQDASQRRIP
jgi:nitrogen-specific signal transduction histidine kinase/CheY-like chemotaxis protein